MNTKLEHSSFFDVTAFSSKPTSPNASISDSVISINSSSVFADNSTLSAYLTFVKRVPSLLNKN